MGKVAQVKGQGWVYRRVVVVEGRTRRDMGGHVVGPVLVRGSCAPWRGTGWAEHALQGEVLSTCLTSTRTQAVMN